MAKNLENFNSTQNFRAVHPERITPIYVGITALFVCFLMIANIAANRLWTVGGLILTGDLLLFPLTYIFGDVLTEVYGFKQSRLTIWLGMAANIIMAGYFMLLINLPLPAEFTTNESFRIVLGTTPIVVFASILAYFGGEFTNSATLSVMKKLTKGRHMWTRTIGSTVFGQIVDTLIFMLIVFWSLPADVLWQMIIVQYIFKVGYEVLATPFTYLVVSKIKKIESIDTYDYGIKYNPFSLEIDGK